MFRGRRDHGKEVGVIWGGHVWIRDKVCVGREVWAKQSSVGQWDKSAGTENGSCDNSIQHGYSSK